MDIIEQFAEIRRKETLEEGRREGAEEESHRFIRRLLKEPSLTLEKIALLANVSLETVKKINTIAIVEQMAEIKKKEILEECDAKEYAEDYSIRYARSYVESYKVGLRDGIELVNRCLAGDS
jgi:hypothetical protein